MLTREQKEFNATGEGQKEMAAAASRRATLHQLNEAIRKMDPSEAYDRSIIDALPDSGIEALRDSMIIDYNRLIKLQPTH